MSAVSAFLSGMLLVFGLSFVAAFPVMWLWDWVMPSLFGLSVIAYWKAWGLFLLCSLLFK